MAREILLRDIETEDPGPSFPSFPFYVRDWLTGTGTTAMSPEQRGAFIDLLCHAWLSRPPCSLPADDAILGKLSGLGARWRKVGGLVRAQFAVGPDGRLRNPKQQRVWDGLLAFRAQKREAGSQSATARRERYGTAQPNGLPNDAPNEPPNGSRTDARTTPEQPFDDPFRTPPEPSSSSSSASASAVRTIARAQDGSPSTPLRGHTGSGVLAGALPRDHLGHAFCDATYSRCVPRAVHDKLANLLAPKYGGDRGRAGEALRAFYATTVASVPEAFVMGDAFKFWQARFDAAFATPPGARRCHHAPRCADDVACTQRELHEQLHPDTPFPQAVNR